MLQAWIWPIAILPLTALAVQIARALLKSIAQQTRLDSLREVVPSLASLVYLVGFKIFLEAAPLHPRFEKWAEDAIYILGVLILLSIIRKIALLAVNWTAHLDGNSVTLKQGFEPMIRNMVTLSIFLVGGIMVLKHFNYDVMSLLTALGVGSLAVGLAAKETLSNMISGFTLIIDRNLRPGDQINLAGDTGEVEEIGLRSTRIRTGAGNTLIVPNNELVNTRILNLSLPNRSVAGNTQLRVPFTVPFATIHSICLEVLAGIRGVSREKPPTILLTKLTEYGQLITITFWIEDVGNENKAISEFNEKLLARLYIEKIPLVTWTPVALPS